MPEAERITLLEERYAHLQRHVVQQDKAMLALTDEVARLRQEIASLRARAAGETQAGEMPDERPPHY